MAEVCQGQRPLGEERRELGTEPRQVARNELRNRDRPCASPSAGSQRPARRQSEQHRRADALRRLAVREELRPLHAYGQSAGHPGLTTTNLQISGPSHGRAEPSTMDKFSWRRGHQPALDAASSPDALNGAFYGPRGLMELAGGGVIEARIIPSQLTVCPPARPGGRDA
jgi:hypothetical protein